MVGVSRRGACRSQFERLLALTAGLVADLEPDVRVVAVGDVGQMVRSASSMIWARDLVAQMLRVFIA
jgi:hypothetical protein